MLIWEGHILMTRITFLIGNGFDLNVGLKTTCKDFYQYYIQKNPNDMLAQSIQDNNTFWSDLELGLGRYTGQVKPSDEGAFWKSEENLEGELANYLDKQMESISINDDEKRIETALEMQRSLTEFSKELPHRFQLQINNIFDSIRDRISYSFISFNYTTSLDECLNITKELIPDSIGKHNCSGGLIYSHDIGDIIHIHGTTESEMVLGVNDITQITNKNFSNKGLYKQLLIKEESIKRYDSEKIEDACRYIDSSVIICVFGMSIGSTDKRWWQYICKWLLEEDNRLLIIYAKTTTEDRIGRHTLFSKQDEMINRLKNNAELTGDIWNQIKNRIYVKCNPNIFNFKILANR